MEAMDLSSDTMKEKLKLAKTYNNGGKDNKQNKGVRGRENKRVVKKILL